MDKQECTRKTQTSTKDEITFIFNYLDRKGILKKIKIPTKIVVNININ